MVAQVNVGTIGASQSGQGPQPGNIAQSINFSTGQNVVTQVGTIGAVDVGRNAVAAGPVGTTVDGGGDNAITIGNLSEVAGNIDAFTITWTPSVGGPQTRTLNAAALATVDDLVELEAAVEGLADIASSVRNDVAGGGMDIIAPFLSNITAFGFSMSTPIAAEATVVNITGVTNAEADAVDVFAITINGTPLNTAALNLSGVATRAQLAAALDALPQIAVTQSSANGGTITIAAETTGPKTFTNISLADTVATAATASFGAGTITTLNNQAAAAKSFELKLNGSELNLASVNFATIATASDLAGALNAAPNISAILSGSTITISSDVLGAGNSFSELELIDNEGLPATPTTVQITGVSSFAGEVTGFALSIDGIPVNTSPVNFDLAVDGPTLATELDKITTLAVAFSAANGGTLTITNSTGGPSVFSNISLTRPNLLIGSDGVNDNLTGDATGTLVRGLSGDDTLTGLGNVDQLEGGADNDTLNGGGSADIMIGGSGNDFYFVDNAGDVVVEGAGGGTGDRIFASVSYTMGAGVQVEKLTTVDNAAATPLNLTGNELANTIFGNAGANTLDGKAGADTLAGLGGDDFYFVDNAGDAVSEGAGQGTGDRIFASVNYTMGAGVQVEKLTTVDNAVATPLNLTGNELANIIFGNAGANTLDGKAGADTLAGLGGDDFYFVDNAVDVVSEGAGGGTADRIFASVSYTMGAGVQVEKLTTVDSAATTALNLTGNDLANIIFGNAGANSLDGKAGADTLAGLGGNDWYFIDDAADTVSEGAGEGAGDRVFAAVSYTLGGGVQVEGLSTDATPGTVPINLTGNEFANSVIGNAGSNVLRGLAGNDTVFGGLGVDAFVFDTALNAATNVDGILDFTAAEDDMFLSSGVFTTITVGTLAASDLVIGGAAADASDRIIYNNASGALFFDADGLGGVPQVQFATLMGAPAITNADFVVV